MILMIGKILFLIYVIRLVYLLEKEDALVDSFEGDDLEDD